MSNQTPNGILPITTNPREEELIENSLKRYGNEIKSYVMNELTQAGWSFVENTDGTGMNLVNQAEAMATIIRDKLVKEGRQLLNLIREDYGKKMTEICEVKIESLEAAYNDKYGTFLRKIEFDIGTSIVQLTQKHQFENSHEVKTMVEDLKEMKPFLKAGEGKSYLGALKTAASLANFEKDMKPILEQTQANTKNIADSMEDMRTH